MSNDIKESFEKTRLAGSIASAALDEVEKIKFTIMNISGSENFIMIFIQVLVY